MAAEEERLRVEDLHAVRAVDLAPALAGLEPLPQLRLVVVHDQHQLAVALAGAPEPVLVVDADRPRQPALVPSTLTAPVSPKLRVTSVSPSRSSGGRLA